MRSNPLQRYLLQTAVMVLGFCFSAALSAQAAGPAASAIMTQAKTQALAEHKNILAVFSASWCGPCHMFEAFLKDLKVAPLMNRAFVTETFDVGEKPDDKRHADTPGAVDLRAALGGADAGYPFIAMLDPAANPIVDSMRPDHGKKENIGYPAIPAEIDWFMQMLRKAAPSLSPADMKVIRAWLDAHGEAH